MKLMRLAFVTLLFVVLTTPASAITNEELAELSASNGFYRASVMTTSGYTGSEVLTDFPVLVRIKPGSPSGFAYSDMMFPDSGKDLGFVDIEGNGLPFEIDTWRGANDESLVWVTLPAVSNSTQFAMVYRSSKSGKILNAANPFTTYTGVWHLNESGAANTAIVDASGKGFEGAAKGIAESISSGKLGGAWKFNNVYDRVDAGIVVDLSDSAKLASFNGLGDTFHVSLWLCPHGQIGDKKGICWNALLGHKEQSATPAWGISFNQNPKTIRVYSQHADGNKYASSGDLAAKGFKQNVWGKLDVVYYTSGTSGKFNVYFNGTNVTSAADLLESKVAVQGSSNFGIGCFADRTTDRTFFGAIDEVRLLAGQTSGDRIRADYDTVAKSSFLAADSVVTFEEPPKPVFGHEVVDVGAAFVQFSGSISVLGGEGAGAATSCNVLAKAWPTSGSEPGEWTTIATGLAAGDSFKGTLTGLTPLSAYTYKIKAVNNIPYDSDVESEAFETSGVGDAGTGGTVERQLDEFVHTFVIAPDGTATFSFTPPADVNEVDALIVGGGGPGGYYAGGGGGGGGLIYTNEMRVTGGATYTVTVGAGGEHATSVAAYGTNGGDSSIVGTDVSVTADGGGAGGNGKQNNQTATLAGAAGGSGGGATWKDSSGGSATAGQGNAGGMVQVGQKEDSVKNHAGGGGGAAKAGSPAVGVTGAQSSGSGGDGLQIAISGVNVYYAGGGGGGGNESNLNGGWGMAGGGGSGGGGKGGQYAGNDASAVAEAGTDNLGGGGGGGAMRDGFYTGGDGGNGIVIIRYGAGGNGQGATAPTVSLTGLDYDSETGKAILHYRVAWAGSGYQTARVSAIWGYSEDALLTTNLLETAIIGAGSENIELPRVSRTVYIRVVAENAGGATGVSPEILSVELFNPQAPEATATLASTGCTNAVFSVDVTSLGQGASNATVSIQVARNLAFTGDVLSFPDQTTITATGAAAASAWGLDIGTTYYARAVVSNNIDQVCETDAIRFTTLVPGPPHGTALNGDPGYTTLSAFATTTDFGVGSASTAMRLEVSTTAADFASLESVSAWVDATVGQQETLTCIDLAPDAVYLARVCLSNWWGQVTYLPLQDTATRAVPFAASGLSFSANEGGTIDFSFPVTCLYDGATVSATLTYNGAEVGTEQINTPAPLSWTGVSTAAVTATATVVATATLPGGETVVKEWTVSVVPGTSSAIISDVTAYASAANALWMRPGDVVLLPVVAGGAFYQALNPRFAAVDGNTLTALEPGIVGIRCVDANAATNIMGVVVLPDAIGSGSVYVFSENKYNGKAEDYCWSDPSCWRKVGSETNESFPKNVDDIAILPFFNKTGDLYIRHLDDITIGGLYAGQIRPDVSVACCLERYKWTDATRSTEATAPRTVTFRRSDGGTVDVKVCPNGENGTTSSIQFGGYNINVTWAGDILIDGCSSETDLNGPRGLIKYKDSIVITNTAENATITVQGLPGYWVNGTGGTTKFNGVWKGTVEFVKKGQGSLVLPEDFSSLSGIVRDATGPSLGNLGAPAAGVLMRAAGASNITAHVYGWGSYDHSSGVMSYNGLSRGTLGTGGMSVAPEKGAQGPAKGLHMHGGTYRVNSIDNANWGVGVKDEKAFDVLSVGAGLNYISLEAGKGNGSAKPINAVTAKTLIQADKGTLVVYDPSHNADAATSVTNNMFSVLDWADHAVGAAGDPEKGAAYPIVPWMVFNRDSNYSYLSFAAFDANGRTVRPKYVDSQIDAVSSPDVNAWVNDKHLNNGSATDIVVLSLFLNNANKNKWLGADRTLTISSGGLILGGVGTAIGLPGRDDNGALVLGDATHPGYVWVKSYTGDPARIWAAVTAPGGFVSTYTGNLELGGDQTGIDDEIVVNCGTLALGNTEYGIQLKDGLPVRVCAGAKLILPSSNAIAKSPLKIDGSAEAFGKVELPVNQTCASLAVRDVFESDEWDDLPEGTYGSSESSAEFVRDDLFVGPGVLRVGAAPTPNGVMFLIY